MVTVISAIFGAIRANGGSGSRARTAPIVQKVTFRENSAGTTRAIWTAAGIQSGVGAVSAFAQVAISSFPKQKEKEKDTPIRLAAIKLCMEKRLKELELELEKFDSGKAKEKRVLVSMGRGAIIGATRGGNSWGRCVS